jgi:hypothetical protein
VVVELNERMVVAHSNLGRMRKEAAVTYFTRESLNTVA